MNNFSQIIKEYDIFLYIKQNNDKNNKDLLLFEKKVLEFKNNQIKLLQKLINYLRGNIDLNDFYLDLNFNNFRNYINKKDNEKLLSTVLNNENKNKYKYNDNSASLPVLTKNYEIKPKNELSLLTKKSKNKLKNNKTLEEKEIEDIPLFKNKKVENQGKIFNKNNTLVEIKENIKNKNYLKKNKVDNNESDNSQSENSTLSKPQNKFQTIIPRNTINEKNNDSSNISKVAINKNLISDEDDDENIDHKKLINSKNNLMKNSKIVELFQISESDNNISKENDSSKISSENSKKEDDNLEIKNISRKSINRFVKNNKLGFTIRDKSRKATKRAKKMGINANDFLI